MPPRRRSIELTPEQERHYRAVHTWLADHCREHKTGRCRLRLVTEVAPSGRKIGKPCRPDGPTEWARKEWQGGCDWAWDESDFDVEKFVETCRPCHAKVKSGRGVCVAGHPRTAENTYVTPEGKLQCRICNRETRARFIARRESGS
jgi:hypothetical protein